MEMSFCLKINNWLFRFSGIEPGEIPANSQLFAVAEGEAVTDYFYHFHFVDSLPAADAGWNSVYQKHNIHVYRRGELERRLISVASPADAYAVYEETSDHGADIWFLRSLREELTIDTMFVSCLALERRMLVQDAYILHCCYLCYQGKALLFSGPSGAGKSTHADLWVKNIEGCHVVNGDRCLISRGADGRFMAHGWPVCGSSGICHVESHPIEAIVFIEQTPLNQPIPENTSGLFRRLIAQITINYWDHTSTEHATDWVLSLMGEVKTMVYGCNMEDDASTTLHKIL